MSFPHRCALLAVGLLLSLSAAAQNVAEATYVNTKDLKWGAAPPVLPKGAQLAVLFGDPSKSGPFVIRLMTPAGYKIAPHWHSQTENLTIITGALYLGEGDAMDNKHVHEIRPGGYHYLPAKAHHYAYSKANTVIQIHGEGPFDITNINDKDDPQKMAARK
jgi:hypothetical protein